MAIMHGLHHYYFWLYALDTALDLAPKLDREQLLDAIAPTLSNKLDWLALTSYKQLPNLFRSPIS
jgi:phosphatidylethanolamine-binding protein (PEBP) family uncharacterized protein